MSKSKSWIFTNPETRETYRFQKLKNGIIKTVSFLGYRCPNGRILKRYKNA